MNTDYNRKILKAAEEGSVQKIQDLIKLVTDAEPDKLTKLVNCCRISDGQSPLYRAAQRGHLQAVQTLVNARAHVNTKNKSDSWTALHIASSNGFETIVQYLIEQRAEVNSRTYEHETPLHLAAFKGRDPVIPFLIDADADINSQDNSLYTPLHWAASAGNENTFKLLVTYGADLEIRDGSNRKAVDLAKKGYERPMMNTVLAAQKNPPIRPAKMCLMNNGDHEVIPSHDSIVSETPGYLISLDVDESNDLSYFTPQAGDTNIAGDSNRLCSPSMPNTAHGFGAHPKSKHITSVQKSNFEDPARLTLEEKCSILEKEIVKMQNVLSESKLKKEEVCESNNTRAHTSLQTRRPSRPNTSSTNRQKKMSTGSSSANSSPRGSLTGGNLIGKGHGAGGYVELLSSLAQSEVERVKFARQMEKVLAAAIEITQSVLVEESCFAIERTRTRSRIENAIEIDEELNLPDLSK